MIATNPAQIEKSKTFLERLWRLENDDRPGFLIGYVGPRIRGGRPVRSALFSTEGEGTVRDRLLDPGKFLDAQLVEINDQMAYRGDIVPCLCPAFGVINIPAAFGCEVVWWENNFPSVRPLSLSGPKAVRDLPRPTISSGEMGRILDYTRYFIEETKGRIPIRLTDIQGPLDSGALIMGHTELFTAIRTHPWDVHYLLQMITDVTIECARAQREVVRGCGVEFVPSLFQPWIPDGFGISVSNDASVMISADEHDEFCLPYLNQISDAFGGIYVHSCGNWLHQVPSLARVRGLRGLEFGASETPFPPLTEYFQGRTVLACRVGLHRDVQFKGMADYVASILKAAKTNRGLFIHVDITNGLIDETWPETDLDEIYGLLNA
ncbi:MAG: uroporphyrinogen decarboxylase family protein [Candidatus Aminicenantales bacterium]